MAYRFVKKELAPSGRWAILAREAEDDPWFQIESVSNEAQADDLLDDLENDDSERLEYIEDYGGSDWGRDAPPL